MSTLRAFPGSLLCSINETISHEVSCVHYLWLGEGDCCFFPAKNVGRGGRHGMQCRGDQVTILYQHLPNSSEWAGKAQTIIYIRGVPGGEGLHHTPGAFQSYSL